MTRAGLIHPHSERWTPYKDRTTGEIVTVTWEQVAAIHHAVRCVDQMRREMPSQRGGSEHYPPLSEDFYGMKSRALGRLLVDGLPLFEDVPPILWAAPAYGLWDEENERG